MSTTEAARAVRRFGLGARPGELAALGDPRARLTAGVVASAALPPEGLPTRAQAATALGALREAADGSEAAKEARDALRDLLQAEVGARFRRALTTPDGFTERLVWFWSNHFTVSTTRPACVPFVGLFEREVVRAHLQGTFEHMLLAAAHHPAMALYLDQARSFGPSSALGRARGRGLNENLAREILELHTLGVRSGYGQADVEELARALTGWTVALPGTPLGRYGAAGEAVFVEGLHEPGERTVLGQRWPDRGPDQADDVLRALARHPATARHLSTKLVRHLVADDPPPAAVEAVTEVFLASGGDLPSVHRALVERPEAWDPTHRKRTQPTEFAVAGLRALGGEALEVSVVVRSLEGLGQAPWSAPSPAGWPDTAAEWGGADALSQRLDLARRIVRHHAPEGDPIERFVDVWGPELSPATRDALSHAPSREMALVLGLVAPESQWR